MTPSPSSVFVTAPDGLRLHARCWGSRTAASLPVVCLPGLARTAADFDELASALAGDARKARRVIALDSRGRGGSAYDPNPVNYNLKVELGDLLAVLTALAVGRAAFVGTSRGGLLTMLLAAARPAAIAGCILNDIGPVIETKGVMRIKSYVGKLPQPRSMRDGADILRRLFDGQFPMLNDEEWLTFARRTFKEEGTRIVADYDPALSASLGGIDPEWLLPPMWREFDALSHVPMMVIRGRNSDILSAETVQAMRRRRAWLDVVEVPEQGHAPILGGSIITQMADFITRIG